MKSLTVISPRSRPDVSTSGSFSTLLRLSRSSASARPTPTGAVTSGIGVITSATRRSWSVTKRMSRLVTMPSSVPSGPVTGTPEIRKRPHSSSTSATVASGPQVTGLVIIPASDRFTVSTCWACSSTDMFRCSTPTPPWRAMAMAIRDSVTVSMAADTSGMRERDVPAEPGGGVGLIRQDHGMGREQQHVIVGQAGRAELQVVAHDHIP